MFEKLKTLGDQLKNELKVYQLVLKDKSTPLPAKWLLGTAVGYIIMPFDLIPDFIPVIGHIDDAIIVPALIFLALKMIPKDVIDNCRSKVIHDKKS